MDSEIRKAIDCCRPGSNDIQSPEMEALRVACERDAEVLRRYELTQNLDASTSQALQQVDIEVPAGLLERLLAGMEATPQADAAGEIDRVTPASRRSGLQKLPPAALLGRQRAKWAALILAAAAVLLVVAAWQSMQPSPLGSAELAQDVQVWIRQLLDQEAKQELTWRNDLAAAPFSRPEDGILNVASQRWVSLGEMQLGTQRPTVYAYDLMPPGRERAFLFVVRTSIPVRVSSYPKVTHLLPSTGHYQIGACVGDKLLLVVAVEGDQNRFNELVRRGTELVQVVRWPQKTS